jgi:hypothetical protein
MTFGIYNLWIWQTAKSNMCCCYLAGVKLVQTKYQSPKKPLHLEEIEEYIRQGIIAPG